MNDLAPFTFPETGQQVRTLLRDGEVWFVGKDACDVVGISKYRDALAQLDDDERVSATVDTPGGPQVMTLVNEPGVYGLMLISRSPKVKSFKRWLTHEVIPAIRKSGRFEVAATTPLVLSNRDLARMVIEEADRADTAEALNAELAPKALAHDTYLSADGSDRLVRQVAKLLGWTEKQLRLFLTEEKFIFHRQAPCGQSQWDLYAGHKEHFHPVEKVVEHSWGHCSHYTLYVTAAGIDAIQRRVAKRQSEMRAAIAGAPVA